MLNAFWPYLKVIQCIGLFHCKKTKENKLKPIEWKVHLPLAVISIIVMQAANSLLVQYSFLWTDAVIMRPIAFNPDTIGDVMVTYLSAPLVALMDSVIHYGNYKIKGQLCVILNDLPDDQKWIGIRRTFMKVATCFFMSQLLLGISILDFNTPWYFAIMTVTIVVLAGFVMAVPSTLTFFIIYLEITNALLSDIGVLLRIKITSENQYKNEVLPKCQELLELLDKANKLFSRNIFWLMILQLCNLTLYCYLSFESVYSAITLEEEQTLQIQDVIYGFNTVFLVLYGVLLVFHFNAMSQNCVDKLKELKTHLKKFYVNEQSMMTFQDFQVPVNFVKSQVIENIEEFQGFDGKNYFSLGKSFLVTGTAFWMGILLFLLQFKID